MSLPIRFIKMHSLGNDFIILDGLSQFIPITRPMIRQISQRKYGIGCDQVLVIEAPTQPQYDFLYRIFNADGREVEQCGNGARCIAKYLSTAGLFFGKTMRLETLRRPVTALIDAAGQVTVDMGEPFLEPQDIPIVANRQSPHLYPLTLFHETHTIAALSLGNPHAIFRISDTSQAPVEKIGRALQKHPAFPQGVNVGFCQVLARNHIRLRVFERGVGETLACGSGACAAVVAGILNQELSSSVRIDLPGGSLTVQWEGPGSAVYLSGPTQSVCTGEFLLERAPKPHFIPHHKTQKGTA